jgi:hypothetical protein
VSKLDDLQRLKATKTARFAVPSPSARNSSKGDGHEVQVIPPQKDIEIAMAGDRRPAPEPRRVMAAAPNSKRGGRPLARDAANSLSRTKPWEAEGMSRRTWYRRTKEQSK